MEKPCCDDDPIDVVCADRRMWAVEQAIQLHRGRMQLPSAEILADTARYLYAVAFRSAME